ncbi:MAG TPA: four helix bundle protein [Anaerolineae bacterium]|nr:four helix bundle protein [Anaerolineae bacterium]
MKHNYRQLDVWRRAIDFVTEIYRLSQKFPKEEQFGLTSQIRRAAVSISLNIAEGSGASSNAEFVRFLEIARRSAYEVMTALEIAEKLKYLLPNEKEKLTKEADEISAMLTGLIKSMHHSR